ncbi:mechanosensitive ion channel protein MscS [Hydrococcus rivularis NIES-593]|uniref:Mechanosensitive ion channel protein MscS n=1 Tax=Hydrococcus rivularis NIES-593 TaxID=1921803 RepID=A0A1U7HFR8_9CYAN|nr:mechanosensitive ion channel family protein [Hydrococcus rivularis]OKH22378.1 mechanosensitive ion channel protein MscS [Hydrococcus rivularis NIES-593]
MARRKRILKRFALIVSTVVAIAVFISPARSQFSLPNFGHTPNWFIQNADNLVVSDCIRLDGRCLFKIASPKSDLSQRVDQIEQRLEDISDDYFNRNAESLKVESRIENNVPNIYVSVGDREVRLLSVTNLDTGREGIDLKTKASEIVEQLETGLQRAKQERQSEFLIRQGIIAGGLLGVMLLLTWIIARREKRLRHSKKLISPEIHLSNHQPISTQLMQRQQWNLKEVQHRLLQLIQVGIWIGGLLLVLGLFPYTRIIQIKILNFLEIPWRIVIIAALVYVFIRLSYAFIAKLNSFLASDYLLPLEADRRVQLRIKTISVVARSIVTILWIGVGILVALAAIGVDITPVLAGVGLLGVAVSLASQNLIKDAINGFLIILEDQYAVGDVISVGDASGLVENINLRITQLRDAEGRLITIPNSKIEIVANLSSYWSRADITIPVAYQADLDKALEHINLVAQEMSQDDSWRRQILETPQVLGVDSFDERGAIVRVWIKTQPLKQWDVSREFRRRIKIKFEQAGIPLPLPQQQVWFSRQYTNKDGGRKVENGGVGEQETGRRGD